ncbi:MAG: pyruvate kinase [Nitrospirae bacterium]|nr:pyruvate kinase [Nitrospirota bacterium]
MTKTKIVATLGPATSTPEAIVSLAKAGADLFRLNMSHGDRETHRASIRLIRSLPETHGIHPVGIIGDLSGPKVRVGRFPGGRVELVSGKTVTLVNSEIEGSAGSIHVSYEGLGKGLRRGSKVLLDDGMLELKVMSASHGEVICKVVKGGTLKDRKGVNFPGLPLELPSLTDKDKADLAMLVEESADYVALSFVRSSADVVMLKHLIASLGGAIPVIAKIERPEAVKDIKSIVEAADGVMVARGDLGVEMAPELVPPIQKRLIRLCNEMKKPVITATQMLESMITNPRPTRAEASDVAGAVFDGTDALMLSGETASGSYPEASVTMMNAIAREAERHLADGRYACESMDSAPQAIAQAACRTADELKAKSVICFSRSGATALLVSKYRPATHVIAATPDEAAYRRMRLYYGVTPVMVRQQSDTDGMIAEVEGSALSAGLVRPGDRVVVTLGVPVSGKAETNLMKVHRVGDVFGR